MPPNMFQAPFHFQFQFGGPQQQRPQQHPPPFVQHQQLPPFMPFGFPIFPPQLFPPMQQQQVKMHHILFSLKVFSNSNNIQFNNKRRHKEMELLVEGLFQELQMDLLRLLLPFHNKMMPTLNNYLIRLVLLHSKIINNLNQLLLSSILLW